MSGRFDAEDEGVIVGDWLASLDAVLLGEAVPSLESFFFDDLLESFPRDSCAACELGSADARQRLNHQDIADDRKGLELTTLWLKRFIFEESCFSVLTVSAKASWMAMAGPEGAGDKLGGWWEGGGSARMHGKDRVWLSRDLGGKARAVCACLCMRVRACVCMILCEVLGSDAGERTNVEDLSTCSASRDGRGTAVGADDRSMGRGPRLKPVSLGGPKEREGDWQQGGGR